MTAQLSTGFKIEEVISKKDKSTFADVARKIYKDDREWICPLDLLIENVFDQRRNPSFLQGEACRWIVKDRNGEPVGRIAAFLNERKIKLQPFPVGGVGFFECIDNTEPANLLFDTAAAWLKERKVEAMDGPINFGENDRYWGLLVEGFTAPPFTTNYNKPYYRKLFEGYGFQQYYEMFTNEIDLTKKMDPRFENIASWINKKNDIVFRHASLKNLPEFAEYFREIYNEAWQFHDGYTPITVAQAKKFAADMKNTIIDGFCPFAFVKDEPAGFIIAAPDLNQVFRPFKGRFGLLRKLAFKWRIRDNFSWYRKKGILTKGHAIAIGIKPKFQQNGLEAGMMMSSLDAVRNLGFTTVELRWAGDFNPKVIRLHKAAGGYPVRKHLTLRYMFDKGKEVTAPAAIPLGKRK